MLTNILTVLYWGIKKSIEVGMSTTLLDFKLKHFQESVYFSEKNDIST